MAAARESLSPFLKSASARRLSLELCQKIGTQLLSPVPSLCSTFQALVSPNRNGSVNTSNTMKYSPGRRRGSDFGVETNISSGMGTVGPMRRGSLTPFTSIPYSIPTIKVEKVKNKKGTPLKKSSSVSTLSIPMGLCPPRIMCPRESPTHLEEMEMELDENEMQDGDNDEWLTRSRSRRTPRRKSSSRTDIDDDFVEFVEAQCKLRLNVDHVLGRGSFGTVVTGIYKGENVAVKVISKKSRQHRDSLKAEENALFLPPHPHVATIIDIFQLGSEKALVLMERLMKGNLLKILNDPKVNLDMSRKIRFARDIGEALHFCHSQGILHLDVKPQNVLMDRTGMCKLADFGNSRNVLDLTQLPSTQWNKLEGTVAYKCPELFRGQVPTEKCDVYSLGITMWQILSRESPYNSETEHSIIYKVVAQGLRPTTNVAYITAQMGSSLNVPTLRKCSTAGVNNNRGRPLASVNVNQEECQNAIIQYMSLYEKCWADCPTLRPDIPTILKQLEFLQTCL